MSRQVYTDWSNGHSAQIPKINIFTLEESKKYSAACIIVVVIECKLLVISSSTIKRDVFKEVNVHRKQDIDTTVRKKIL